MMVPDYQGSSDYTAAPLAFFNFRYDQYYIQSEGLGVKANASPFRAIEAGPVLSLNGGRDDDVESDAVGRLREIDDAVEAELFVTLTANYALTKNWGLVGIAGYTRLIGDAADSPIVDVEGDARQGRLGLGVSYRF